MAVRNALIMELRHKGHSQDFIAKVFGITSARVCQILGGY
jgi:predicted transcriptional regulator